MKTNRILVYISCVLSFVLLGTSIYIKIYLHNDIFEFINSIVLNVFAGSFLLSVTSFVYYLDSRKKVLRTLINELSRIANSFSKIEYLDVDQSKDEEFVNKLNQYINLSDYSLNEFWNTYEDMYFLLDIFNKKKHKLYNDLYVKVSYYLNIVEGKTFDFKIYLSSKRGNKEVNKEFLKELQNSLFFIETCDGTEVPSVLKNVHVSYYTRHVFNGKNDYQIIYNKASNDIMLLINEVGKICYMDKKYNWLGCEDNE